MRKAPASFKYLFSSQLIEDWDYRLPETQRKEESQVLGSIASHLTTRCTKAYGAYHKWKRQKISYCWSTWCPAEHKLTVQFGTCSLCSALQIIRQIYPHIFMGNFAVWSFKNQDAKRNVMNFITDGFQYHHHQLQVKTFPLPTPLAEFTSSVAADQLFELSCLVRFRLRAVLRAVFYKAGEPNATLSRMLGSAGTHPCVHK